MLTDVQKSSILKDALAAFKAQKGLNFNFQDFDIKIGKPNNSSMCSLNITSNRRDDNFKIKLYVKGFNNFSSIGSYYLTQEENYSNGLNDEVFIADCTLDKVEYRAFYGYLLSPKFTADVVNNSNKLMKEDGGHLLLENGFKILMEG